MPVITSDKDKIGLDFNTRIYSRGSILKALQDFRDVCKIDFKEDGDRILITMPKGAKDELTELENIGYELFNYVLGLMKNSAEV